MEIGNDGRQRVGTHNANDADFLFESANFSSMDADVDDGDLVIHSSPCWERKLYHPHKDGLVVFDIRSGGGSFTIRHDDARINAQGISIPGRKWTSH